MVSVMPGATLVESGGGSVATGTITFATAAAAANDTVVVNGATFTFKASPATAYEVAPGASFGASATNLAAALNASTDPLVSVAQYSVTGGVVTVKYGNLGVYGTAGKMAAAGNTFTLVDTGVNITCSGATLTGGADAGTRRVDVTDALGVNLLSLAKELRLHPIDKAAGDLSDDFVIPLAATAGALKFAYKLEEERVYDVEFNGYPDPVTRKLFRFGA
jgi:hypothetical protein